MCIYYTPHQSCYSQPQHDPQDAQFRIPSYPGFSWHLSSTKSCWFNLLLAITRQLHQCMAAFWVYLNSLPAAGRAAVAVIQPYWEGIQLKAFTGVSANTGWAHQRCQKQMKDRILPHHCLWGKALLTATRLEQDPQNSAHVCNFAPSCLLGVLNYCSWALPTAQQSPAKSCQGELLN